MTLPNRHKKHYCRRCTAEFPSTAGQLVGVVAHIQYLQHLAGDHPTDEADLRAGCTKYCSAREQPDEHQHGVKLYGPGAAKLKDLVPLINIYEELFPVEDDA